jgi:hypothetical protein
MKKWLKNNYDLLLESIPFAVLLFFALLFLALYSMSARAEEDQTNVWLLTGMSSYHNNRDAHYREQNTGFGVEIQTSDTTGIYAGNYMNSLNHHSSYLGYAWQPAELFGARVGFLGVIVTGYTKDGSPVIAPVPMASWEWKNFGINLYIAPGVVTAAQLKVKLF